MRIRFRILNMEDSKSEEHILLNEIRTKPGEPNMKSPVENKYEFHLFLSTTLTSYGSWIFISFDCPLGEESLKSENYLLGEYGTGRLMVKPNEPELITLLLSFICLFRIKCVVFVIGWQTKWGMTRQEDINVPPLSIGENCFYSLSNWSCFNSHFHWISKFRSHWELKIITSVL